MDLNKEYPKMTEREREIANTAFNQGEEMGRIKERLGITEKREKYDADEWNLLCDKKNGDKVK